MVKETIYRNLKYFYLVIIAILVIIIIFLRNCNPKKAEYTEPLKAEVAKLEVKKDSVNKQIVKQDSVRVKTIIKWRYLKADTAWLPCELKLTEVINTCDTIILIDSIEIASLKLVNLIDNDIIKDQKIMLKNDSIYQISLNKQIRKERRQKRLALLGLGILSVGLLVK